MVVLSVLIVCALVLAVFSFLINNAQWLLFASAAMVIAAFYLSHRATAAGRAEADADVTPKTASRQHLHVSVDDRIVANMSGRHRVQARESTTDQARQSFSTGAAEPARPNGFVAPTAPGSD
jgi:hypothetical protein